MILVRLEMLGLIQVVVFYLYSCQSNLFYRSGSWSRAVHLSSLGFELLFQHVSVLNFKWIEVVSLLEKTPRLQHSATNFWLADARFACGFNIWLWGSPAKLAPNFKSGWEGPPCWP